MKRVAVLGDGAKDQVRSHLAELRPWLESVTELVFFDLTGEGDLAAAEVDLVLIFGGDGAILAAARRMGDQQRPVLGVNFGKLGFLTACPAREFRALFELLLAGEYVLHKRLMLAAEVVRGTEQVFSSRALNDVVMGHAYLSRMIQVDFSVDGDDVATVCGDGLIVATPTGSTAYSLSAGGPIVYPETDALLVTPICPHSFTCRPLLLPAGVTIVCTLAGDSEAMLTMDGQESFALFPGDQVHIHRAPTDFSLVDSGARSHYTMLRTKLQWGGRLFTADDEGSNG